MNKIYAGGNVGEKRSPHRVDCRLNQGPADPLLARPGLELGLAETERFEIFADERRGVRADR